MEISDGLVKEVLIEVLEKEIKRLVDGIEAKIKKADVETDLTVVAERINFWQSDKPLMIDGIYLDSFPFSEQESYRPKTMECYIEFLNAVGAEYRFGEKTSVGIGRLYFETPINPMSLLAMLGNPENNKRDICKIEGLRVLHLRGYFCGNGQDEGVVACYEYNLSALTKFAKQHKGNIMYRLKKSSPSGLPLEIVVAK